ncbi:MAG: 4-hydroxybenzoate octaprenyltransferase [Zoogloeaceae bacterium]|nr:4-hydroxybenzoate octaprenyltransferase [Zoogloeaceae bacterium]
MGRRSPPPDGRRRTGYHWARSAQDASTRPSVPPPFRTVNLAAKLPLYARLTRLDKPIGILLLLWPTLWALWIAGDGRPEGLVLAIFVAGTVLMRSAGCVINDYADRNFDGHVERTRLRPLATGAVTTREALALAVGLSLVAFALILPLNRLVILLSVPALFLAASYPFTKRFFAIPQAYLGIAFGFGIPMAFAAILGEVPALAWVMLVANVLWAIAYDTEYAMVDRPDDLKIGIKTSAITFGRFDVAAVMLCYAAFFGLMAWIGVAVGRGGAYFSGLVAAAGIAGYHWTLIRHRERSACFRAFRHNNWLGATVFAGLAVDYLLTTPV